MRLLFAFLLMLVMTGCAALPSGPIGQAPAPLAATAIDERALVLGLQSFDATLDAIDLLVEAKIIKPGSPTAVRLADAIDTTRLAFQAAGNAQRAGNTTSYSEALVLATAALADVRTALRPPG